MWAWDLKGVDLGKRREMDTETGVVFQPERH
jgi:hypothetical protein